MAKAAVPTASAASAAAAAASAAAAAAAAAASAAEAEVRAALVRGYADLYVESRLETLDWLDQLGQLGDADELKSKLLFSVIVVSPAFRRFLLAKKKTPVSIEW